MAIPSIPQNFYVQQGNREIYLSWDITVGATSYSVQRSTDGVNFTSLATPATPAYLDVVVVVGTQYWYQVAATNTSGTSAYTANQSIVPSPTGEVSLGQLRLMSQQRADRVNSNFVTLPEWNTYINQSMFELYDLLVTVYEDYFLAAPASFQVDGSTFLYPLPDGLTPFKDQNNNAFAAAPFYKMEGVDLALNTANNGYVTVKRFQFADRNRFVYPNTASTIYGVFNLQYRIMGTNIEFIPTPSAGQTIRLWYIPRLNQLLQDTDLTTTSVSGWSEYVIVDAAIKALQKEESDVTILLAQKMELIKRIQSSAMNRDVGMPDKISDVRASSWGSGNGWGINGGEGGF